MNARKNFPAIRIGAAAGAALITFALLEGVISLAGHTSRADPSALPASQLRSTRVANSSGPPVAAPAKFTTN